MILPSKADRALPLLAGLLLALSFPPARLLLPPFIALVPLLVFIHRLPGGSLGRWRASRGGFLAGVVYFGLLLYWMAVALIAFSPLAILAWGGAVLVLSVLTAGFAAAVHWGRDRLQLPLWLLAPIFWTTAEWIQGHMGDLAFPWLGLGTALAPYPALAGAADLVGARGLSVWVAAINGLLAEMVVRTGTTNGRGSPGLARLGIPLVLLIVAPIGYGAWRMQSIELVPAARVAVVQPNIPEEVKLDPRLALDSSLTALTRLTRQVAEQGGNVDLVVWPEVALPVPVTPGDSIMGRVRGLSQEAGAIIVAGAYAHAEDGDGLFNSAFLVGPSEQGRPRYDKQRLVPFVERVPFVHPGPGGRFGGLSAGAEAPVYLGQEGSRFGILICYESIFASLAREYRATGADFLVNITNDAWFGGDSWLRRTTALWQHPAHLVLRAIETRTGIARAANTGFSMFIDPLGRVQTATDLSVPAIRVAQVYTTRGRTFFTRHGDWLSHLALAAAVLVLLGGMTTRLIAPRSRAILKGWRTTEPQDRR